MPTCEIAPDTKLHYEVDDFTDPWSTPEVVLTVHGLAESGAAWRAWVPHLARRYRVFRFDQRGFGASTPIPADHPWSLDGCVDDLVRFADANALERVHLVSAKLGGTIAMRFAARHSERVKTLSVVSSPASLRESLGAKIPEWRAMIASDGVRAWAAATMGSRLGSTAPAAAVTYWTDLMGATSASTMTSVMRTLADVDVTADLPHIECPTLVMTTAGSALGSFDAVRSWQGLIPASRLMELEGDSYHVAASHPDKCAEIVRSFIEGSG